MRISRLGSRHRSSPDRHRCAGPRRVRVPDKIVTEHLLLDAPHWAVLPAFAHAYERDLFRAAVACALVGLLCTLVFLWSGFTPWSLTVGVMRGFPFLLVAVILYIIAVARDLQQHRLL